LEYGLLFNNSKKKGIEIKFKKKSKY